MKDPKAYWPAALREAMDVFEAEYRLGGYDYLGLSCATIAGEAHFFVTAILTGGAKSTRLLCNHEIQEPRTFPTRWVEGAPPCGSCVYKVAGLLVD